MGGASAQFAIPLSSAQTVHFKNLIDRLTVENTKTDKIVSPVWYPGTHPKRNSAANERLNYIDLKYTADIPKIPQCTTYNAGVGLVSFLAIANRVANPNIGGRNIAGGSDAVEAILKNRLELQTGERCKTYATCYKTASRLFWRDPFFKEFALAFRQHFSSVPVVLAGGMDFGRIFTGKSISTIGENCTSSTGILNKRQLAICTNDVHNHLASKCKTIQELATPFCCASLARLIIVDALWSDSDNNRNEFAPRSGPGAVIPQVNIRFQTKGWNPNNSPNSQWSCDPAEGYAKLFALHNVRTRFKKREVRQVHHHSRRNL